VHQQQHHNEMTLRDVDQIVSAAEDGRHHHVKIEGVVPNQIVLDGNLVHIVQNTDITGADVQWPGEALGAGVEVGTPTASNPATTPWPGMANFTVHFLKVSNNSKKESWDVSTEKKRSFNFISTQKVVTLFISVSVFGRPQQAVHRHGKVCQGLLHCGHRPSRGSLHPRPAHLRGSVLSHRAGQALPKPRITLGLVKHRLSSCEHKHLF
jgi:hypothetical protein